jgi:D-alanyl-D-alanine carboxypeptidase (penicillin-binding protein 5/6)
MLAVVGTAIAVAIASCGPAGAAGTTDPLVSRSSVRVAQEAPATAEIPRAVEDPAVTAAGAVLWDPLDGRVLWGRDADVPRPMASTTKVMTALLAGAASLGLEEGERVPMRVLLEGLMLRSGNDAAIAVAEHVSGTERRFVEAMNARARALGLDDTHFLNSSGLTDDPSHHASPLDLARLADVALQQPAIARWAGSAVASSEAFGTIRNRNELIGAYPGATGVKTGFTTLAGLCLVASAERDGRRYISVVLGSDDHFADSRAVLDHGFDDHRRLTASPDTALAQWRTSAGATPIVPSSAVGLTVPTGVPTQLVVVPSATTAATVGRGDRVGELQVQIGGATVAQAPLVAASAVRSGQRPTVGASVEDALRGLARLRSRSVDG